MTKYLKSQSTAKIGVNYIKGIVKRSGCIFHEIHQENDIGLDGIIEIIIDGKSTGKLIAIQVKSGNSFLDLNKEQCKMSINQHYEYWHNHNLTILGIIYIPKSFSAYIINISNQLELYPNQKTIKIPISNETEFNSKKFKNEIIPNKLNEITFDERLLQFTNEYQNKTLRLIINLSSTPLKIAVSKILQTNTFLEFATSINFKVLSIEQFKKELNQKHFSTLTNKWIGELKYSNDHSVYFSEKNLEYLNPKFLELKQFLIKKKCNE